MKPQQVVRSDASIGYKTQLMRISSEEVLLCKIKREINRGPVQVK